MFGSVGSSELLLILVVALLVLGPKSLANMARSVGKVMGEFRRVSTDFQRTLNAEVALEEEKEKREKARKDVEADLQQAPAATGAATGDSAATADTPQETVVKPADAEDDDFSPPAGSPLDEALKKAAAEAQAADNIPAREQNLAQKQVQAQP